MLYVLHHSKGALMLSAGDRDQVLDWSKRQLGNQGRMVSVTDGIRMDAVNSVERDGTGIGYGDENGCRPLMGVMANLSQEVKGEHGSSESQRPLTSDSRLNIRQPTWH